MREPTTALHEQYAHPPHRGGAQGVWRARLYYLQRRPIPREPFNYRITSSTTIEINVKRMEIMILGTDYAGEMKRVSSPLHSVSCPSNSVRFLCQCRTGSSNRVPTRNTGIGRKAIDDRTIRRQHILSRGDNGRETRTEPAYITGIRGSGDVIPRREPKGEHRSLVGPRTHGDRRER